MSERLAEARSAYAEKIRGLAGVRTESLVRSLARVPREKFLGPGPWKILAVGALGAGYRDTADPSDLYDNVLVAIDPERRLNNGEPVGLLRWLDSLELCPGDRFLHVGCGVGYYTAVAAEAVRPGGRTTGIELDPGLAERARRNVASLSDVEILAGDGGTLAGREFDAIFVNAGATEIPAAWLDSLARGGRMMLPLTVGIPNANLGVGFMLLVRRGDDGYTARFHSPVGVYHCAGARSDAGDARLRDLYAAGMPAGVRGLRRDRHHEAPSCDLHGDGFCISRP